MGIQEKDGSRRDAEAQRVHIIQHSLGLDQYGQGKSYRNHFVTGPGSDDFDDCQGLASDGLMKDHGPKEIFGGMHGFTVTESGRDWMLDNSPPAPKLTAGQRRYREWLRADCSKSFIDWCKYKTLRAFAPLREERDGSREGREGNKGTKEGEDFAGFAPSRASREPKPLRASASLRETPSDVSTSLDTNGGGA